MKKRYLIRYNTDSTDDSNRWRIIGGEHEILVSEIKINVPSYTSKDDMPNVGLKFHIACEGELTIENNIAEIN